MTAPNPAEFLTLADAAREMGLHPQTVAKYVKAGTMPGILVGNTYRIPVAQWLAYKAGTWQPKPAPPKADELIRHRAKAAA